MDNSETLALIRRHLRYGDLTKIAVREGVSLQHVSAVVHGRQTSERILNALIKVATRNKEVWSKAIEYLKS